MNVIIKTYVRTQNCALNKNNSAFTHKKKFEAGEKISRRKPPHKSVNIT